jgi:FkbM family methyltransferase
MMRKISQTGKKSMEQKLLDKKIVYDFGAHNGSNIDYYLLKFDKVIAVEANPLLISEMNIKFKKEIDQEKLVLVNCVVSSSDDIVNFYIHKHNSVLSQFPVPSDLENFDVIKIQSKKASDIIKKFGTPEYVKIDVEHTDAEIIDDIFKNEFYPKYLSAEIHNSLVFSLITASKKYNQYKLLDGKTINEIYSNRKINNVTYTFPFHSAGPMFEDIDGQSMGESELLNKIIEVGLGWKDVHAKRYI